MQTWPSTALTSGDLGLEENSRFYFNSLLVSQELHHSADRHLNRLRMPDSVALKVQIPGMHQSQRAVKVEHRQSSANEFSYLLIGTWKGMEACRRSRSCCTSFQAHMTLILASTSAA